MVNIEVNGIGGGIGLGHVAKDGHNGVAGGVVRPRVGEKAASALVGGGGGGAVVGTFVEERAKEFAHVIAASGGR